MSERFYKKRFEETNFLDIKNQRQFNEKNLAAERIYDEGRNFIDKLSPIKLTHRQCCRISKGAQGQVKTML